MYVYFARSIRGNPAGNDTEMSDAIVAAINKGGHRTQFELGARRNHKQETGDQNIYQRDVEWIGRCDIMIAEVTTPSHGVGYEIAYAKHVHRLPIFCLCYKDTNVSAMITGDLRVIPYRDFSDMEAQIENILENVDVCIKKRHHEWYHINEDDMPVCRQCGSKDRRWIEV